MTVYHQIKNIINLLHEIIINNNWRHIVYLKNKG